eukprot:gene1212-1530_t
MIEDFEALLITQTTTTTRTTATLLPQCKNSSLLSFNNNRNAQFIIQGQQQYSSSSSSNTRSNNNNTTTLSKTDILRKRLLYQSKERGMLENDLLLGSFASKMIQQLSEEQLKQYDLLLQQPDPDIFNWILKKVEVPDEFDNETMKLLQHHCSNNPLGYPKL